MPCELDKLGLTNVTHQVASDAVNSHASSLVLVNQNRSGWLAITQLRSANWCTLYSNISRQPSTFAIDNNLLGSITTHRLEEKLGLERCSENNSLDNRMIVVRLQSSAHVFTGSSKPPTPLWYPHTHWHSSGRTYKVDCPFTVQWWAHELRPCADLLYVGACEITKIQWIKLMAASSW